jgi:hypothetical protein
VCCLAALKTGDEGLESRTCNAFDSGKPFDYALIPALVRVQNLLSSVISAPGNLIKNMRSKSNENKEDSIPFLCFKQTSIELLIGTLIGTIVSCWK